MYRQSVITFVDILGFKNLIEKSTYEQVAAKLKTVRQRSGQKETEDGEGFEPKIIQFSDSIIRIRPLDSNLNNMSRYGLMFYEMLDLVHMQGELIMRGVCVRGGVSIGEVHFDDQTLFGPGFVRAYELESNYANYPRIVIDPALISQLRKDKRLASAHNSLADEFSYIGKNIRKESDGIYSIDYLRSFQTEIDDPENIPVFLSNHKRIIIENAGGESELTSISAKYLWMANYHNAVVAEFTDKFFEGNEIKREDLEVSVKEMPLLQTVEV